MKEYSGARQLLTFIFVAVLLLTFCPLVQGFENPCKDGFIPFPAEVQSKTDHWECQSKWSCFIETLNYLGSNLPNFDETNRVSLGFVEQGISAASGDVFDRVASKGVNMSLEARATYSWAAQVPRDLFQEYVSPYGLVNEGRSNWRPIMLNAVEGIFQSELTKGNKMDDWGIPQVVSIVNNNLWSAGVFSGASSGGILFQSSQTPLIYDPMSVIAFGYASCTGVSIFLVDALRSVGVPARLAGTPAWNGLKANGNHNWLEVWTGPTAHYGASGGWHFIEALPAGAGETLFNPCDKWFCDQSHFANGTQVFASRWQQEGGSGTHCPMAWDIDNTQVPGVDRTAYYQSVCNKC